MEHIKGKLTINEMIDKAQIGNIQTVIVGFTDHYGRLMGKRFDVDFFIDQVVEEGTHACNYLLTTDMEMEPLPGFSFANWELGFGDFHLVPDLNTLRECSWLNKTALVLCDIIDDSSHSLVSVNPKTVLRNQLQHAANMKYEVFAASELEFYMFENSYKDAHRRNFHNLDATGWYLEDYNIMQGTRCENFLEQARYHLKHSGVPVENSKGEWGLGQHELNVKYAEAQEMADRHIVFKQCLKELADQQEMSVSFMAKYHEDQAGSSCHIHMSLWKNNENAFKGNRKLGPVHCSDEFAWFLGGWIKFAAEFMPFYAPTVNSYKRFVDASWAPTRLAWSYDNRTAGFRVVGKGDSLRIECRIPGADVNPYLAYAAALASGLYGIKNNIEPPNIFEGDIYAAKHLPEVPKTLKEAVELFKSSELVKSSFGNEVVEHYTHFFQQEIAQFESAVTDWERRRYFERI